MILHWLMLTAPCSRCTLLAGTSTRVRETWASVMYSCCLQVQRIRVLTSKISNDIKVGGGDLGPFVCLLACLPIYLPVYLSA
jgi:hypothetical protein